MLTIDFPTFKKITERVENPLERSPTYYLKNLSGAYELYFSDTQWNFKCVVPIADINQWYGNEDNFRNDFS